MSGHGLLGTGDTDPAGFKEERERQPATTLVAAGLGEYQPDW